MQNSIKTQILNPEEECPKDSLKDNRLLKVSSILLAFLGTIEIVISTVVITSFLDLSPTHLNALEGLTGLVYNERTIRSLIIANIASSVFVAITCLVACKKGLALHKSTAANTHKQVANCQALSIAIIGFTMVSAVLDALILGRINLWDCFPIALIIIPPILYYKSAEHERRTGFWRGVKRPDIAAKEVPAMSEFQRRFAINQDDGMLYPVSHTTPSDVDIMNLHEFMDHHGDGPIAQHIERAVSSAHHCSANTYGEYLYGAILIPVEEFDATDGAYDHDIAFVWLLCRDHVYFITNDAEDVMLLTRCIDAQSLRKTSCAAVLYELVSYIIHHDNTYLLDLERRLDQLEDNMSTDVNEIPQDFSDYVSETRTDLCVIEGFYKQIADMAEDIETSPAHILSEEARELYSSLDNKASRLASDTHMLREYVLQIRSIYQEKIDVRQNNVMSVLTIVASIFMPLTLLTGWYGMNFENMPELHEPYSYFIMIVLAVLIVTCEICAFKKKRWF